MPLWWVQRKDLYRKYAKIVTEAWWRVILFIPLNWAGGYMDIYSTDDLEEKISFETAICLANHRYTVDWILDWIAAEHFNMLGQCKAFIKAVVVKYPIIGWSMWFNEFVFLSREKNKDISKIKKSIQHLKGTYILRCNIYIIPISHTTDFSRLDYNFFKQFCRHSSNKDNNTS